MADRLGGRQGLDRRRFFQTAAGMAASFAAMSGANQTERVKTMTTRAHMKAVAEGHADSGATPTRYDCKEYHQCYDATAG
jgi:hypothetical protein